MTLTRLRLLAFTLAWLAGQLHAATPLEVRETIFGFDGRVVPGRMNPVSFLLRNHGRAPFEGALVLKEVGGVGMHSGAPYVQAAYVTPQSERWVQFTVFISGPAEEFSLEWGRGEDERQRLNPPAAGPPARVLLSDASDPFQSSAGLKTFPEQLFPTTVAATDGLDGVVLDHSPRWEAVRRETFMDWLRRGGQLLVLPTPTGDFPSFGDQLAPLNFAGDSTRVGAGTVRHLRVARREVKDQSFGESGSAPRLDRGSSTVIYNFEQSIFEKLALLTRPNIHWWLINLMTVGYLVLVGPVHYFLAKRWDYRVSLAALGGLIVVFSLLFAVVGRRGYDETQTVHSVAIARRVEGQRYDVTQWVSAFVTHGDLYTLTHLAPSNLYAAVSTEAVNGQISNGKGGQFVVDMPLYSSRQFVHRAVMEGPDLGVTVKKWESHGDELHVLTLETGASFPADIVEGEARVQDHFYKLKRSGSEWTLGTQKTYAEFLPQAEVQQANNSYESDAGGSEKGARHALDDLRRLLPLLYVRALDGRDYFNEQIVRAPPPADRLVLYFSGEAPAGFHLQGKGFGQEIGLVLYVQEVLKP